MTPRDFASLEDIEFEAGIDFYRVAPEDLRLEHAVEVRNIGPLETHRRHGAQTALIVRARRYGKGGGVFQQPANASSLAALRPIRRVSGDQR
jgi:hypothetical protein